VSLHLEFRCEAPGCGALVSLEDHITYADSAQREDGSGGWLVIDTFIDLPPGWTLRWCPEHQPEAVIA
jgi:hypothetical protein